MRSYFLPVLLISAMAFTPGCSKFASNGESIASPSDSNPPTSTDNGTGDSPQVVSHTIAYGALNLLEPERLETPWGWAQLIRSAEGTAAHVHVEGLTANATYKAHVHSMPCNISKGGGHYKLDPTTTDTLENNELWLALETDDDGSARASTITPHIARGDAFSVVIHDTPNAESGSGNKYLCADVSLDGATWSANGPIETFASAEPVDDTIAGTVIISITPEGTTVEMEVEGLDPDATYASHVHSLPCETNDAGAHYKFDPTTEETLAENELWLPVDVNADGTSSTTLSETHIVRTDAQSVVIHRVVDATTKPKVACATLIRDPSTYLSLTTSGSTTVDFERQNTGSASARIVRDIDNSTHVIIEVEDFPAGTFNAHVHASSCDLNQGSGHYKIDVNAEANDTNELWPTLVVPGNGSGEGYAISSGHIARPEASSVVIHHDDKRICIPMAW